MNHKKIIAVLALIYLCSSSLFAGIFQVKVLFKTYKSSNQSFGAVRVTIINESTAEKNGSVQSNSRELLFRFNVSLKPGEKKVYDLPIYLFNDYGSITVKFGEEFENIHISRDPVKSYENSVLEIKIPGKGQLYFHNNNTNLDSECTLDRIELEELPTNLYCLFPFQIIVLPTEIESSLTAEQFQLLKSYVGFGGKIMLIDALGQIPARWKMLGRENWGSVKVVKKADSIDFANIITKKNIIDPRSGFFKAQNVSFLTPSSSKGIYLGIVLLFIVCIGPINYYLLKKRNKTFLIFFTSPIISLFFSALLIGVFFIKEGFYKHYEGVSLTMVNPHTNQALVNIRNAVYSSNISGKTARPRSGMYFPLEDKGMMNQHIIDLEDKAYLSGGFSKARTANNYGEIRLIECNSKISIRHDGGQIYAKNGFGTKQQLILYDRVNKKSYQSNIDVEPDKEVLLQPVIILGTDILSIFKKTENFQDILNPFFSILDHDFVYIARSDSNEMIPFREKDGFIQGQNLHLIVGVINK